MNNSHPTPNERKQMSEADTNDGLPIDTSMDFPPTPDACLRLIDELWLYLRVVESLNPGPVMKTRIESTYELLNQIGYTHAKPRHLH